jgi:hypothetical protein
MYTHQENNVIIARAGFVYYICIWSLCIYTNVFLYGHWFCINCITVSAHVVCVKEVLKALIIISVTKYMNLAAVDDT